MDALRMHIQIAVLLLMPPQASHRKNININNKAKLEIGVSPEWDLVEQWSPAMNFLRAVSSARARWVWQHQLWRTPGMGHQAEGCLTIQAWRALMASSACWGQCSATRFGLCLCLICLWPSVACCRQCSLPSQGNTPVWAGVSLSWARLPGRAGRRGFRYKLFLGAHTSHKHQHLEHLQVAAMHQVPHKHQVSQKCYSHEHPLG